MAGKPTYLDQQGELEARQDIEPDAPLCLEKGAEAPAEPGGATPLLNLHATEEPEALLAEQPIALTMPYGGITKPVVVSSPHSGRIYPSEFVKDAALDPVSLRRSEDCFVEDLMADVSHLGVPLLAARFPRAFLDPNREAFELDPNMFHDDLPDHVNTNSARVMGGLGTIARVVSDGKGIYADKLNFADAERRVKNFYHPYHETLQKLLRDSHDQFGHVTLIDVHSMPSAAGQRRRGSRARADIVLGDRFGRACYRAVTDAAHQILADAGLRVARNDPYAGGYITEEYGTPQKGFHAIQIEINRGLYMDEQSLMPTADFGSLRLILTRLVEQLGSLPASRLAGRV